MFNCKEEYLRSSNPEWFKDPFDGDVPYEEIEDIQDRLEERAKALNKQVNEIHSSLIHSDPEDDSQNYDAIRDIQAGVVALVGYVEEIKTKIPGFWVSLIIGGFAGFAIAFLR